METILQYLTYAIVIGAGATAVIDLWSLARKQLLGIPSPDYALVGRWIAWMPRGRFRHDPIGMTPPVHGERLIGWAAHYAIGAAFAAVLLAVAGLGWVRQPTLAPPLLVGTITVTAPFLVMQPAMGAGIAASRTPRPGAARLQSLVTHFVFGLGLYASGWVLSALLVELRGLGA